MYKKLIILGVQVDYETSGGLTALGEACKIGSIEIASYLIRHGADVNYKNIFHETPLIQAVEYQIVVIWLVGCWKIQKHSRPVKQC